MGIHSSLSAEFSSPSPLSPVRKMTDPYALCWCGSGKKWKWCHKDRDKQSADPMGARIHAMKQEVTKEGYCLHPDAEPGICGDRIIKAHTVQRKGGLAAITENGHVISAKQGFQDISKNNGKIIPREVSAREASTFMGFCNRHDDEMFKSVETGLPVLNQESIFLLSFRALSYEILMKQFALRCMPFQRENDKGRPFEFQAFMQQHLNAYEHGLKLGLQDLLRWKSDYDLAFINRKFDSFQVYGVAFSESLPVVGSGTFHPEFDFYGNPLQRLGRNSALYEHMTYNLTVLNGVSVVVFGWMQEADGPANKLVKSYKELPDSEKADAAVRLAFEQIENIYFKPSWWNGLPKETSDDAIRRMFSGTGIDGLERQPDCLRDAIVKYVSAEVGQEIY